MTTADGWSPSAVIRDEDERKIIRVERPKGSCRSSIAESKERKKILDDIERRYQEEEKRIAKLKKEEVQEKNE